MSQGPEFSVSNPRIATDPSRVTQAQLFKYFIHPLTPPSYRPARVSPVFRPKFLKMFFPQLLVLGGCTFGLSRFFSRYSDLHVYTGFLRSGQTSLISRMDDSDLSYNKEFQKSEFLSEGPINHRESTFVSPSLLAELGISTAPAVAGEYTKRAPHPKYY